MSNYEKNSLFYAAVTEATQMAFNDPRYTAVSASKYVQARYGFDAYAGNDILDFVRDNLLKAKKENIK